MLQTGKKMSCLWFCCVFGNSNIEQAMLSIDDISAAAFGTIVSKTDFASYVCQVQVA